MVGRGSAGWAVPPCAFRTHGDEEATEVQPYERSSAEVAELIAGGARLIDVRTAHEHGEAARAGSGSGSGSRSCSTATMRSSRMERSSSAGR